MMVDTAEVRDVLALTAKLLPRPDHTGDIDPDDEFKSVPLERNTCPCEVHTAHRKTHTLLATLPK